MQKQLRYKKGAAFKSLVKKLYYCRPNVFRGLDSRTGLADWTRGLDSQTELETA